MRWFFALFFITTLSTPHTFAVVDPDPDGIGVYFDFNADVSHIMTEPGPPFYAYVILTNPTAEYLLDYEFAYRVIPTPGLEHLLIRLDMDFPDFVPHDLTTPYYEIISDEVSVRTFYSTPMPGSSAVVLLTWQFLLLGPMEVEFYFGPTNDEDGSSGQLGYNSEVGFVTMNPSSGDTMLPVARVNGDGVVPIAETTFGSLKALYR